MKVEKGFKTNKPWRKSVTQGISITNIILIGFMGVGKTTIGQGCAYRLGWEFVDSDTVIEKLTKASVSHLFDTYGERHFRQLESQVLDDVLNRRYQVVSTGGGIVTSAANFKKLQAGRSHGSMVIWLKADTDVIWQRLKNDISRPLLNTTDPQKKIGDLLSERYHLYQQLADYVLDTSTLTIEDSVRGITKLVK